MKTQTTAVIIAVSLAVILLVAGPVSAGKTEVSIGLGAGYFFPFGDWKAHRYAEIDQFGGSLAIQGDFEIRFTRRFGMALAVGYFNLDTSKWENYAALWGDDIDASAQIVYIGLQFKPHMWEDSRHTLALILGLNYCFPSGRETFQSTIYNYDFMKIKFGYQIGIELDRYLSSNVAITVSVSGLIIPNGIEYADGLSYTVMGVPVTAGIRYRF